MEFRKTGMISDLQIHISRIISSASLPNAVLHVDHICLHFVAF